MKIAIDISQTVYEGTGVALYTKELVRHLLMLDRENDYLLFGVSLGRLNLLQEYFKEMTDLNNRVSCKFLPLPEKFINTFWNKLHIINIESIIGNIDILHSSDWIQPPTKAHKVTTVHDLVVYKFPEISHPYIIETQKKRLAWVKKECDQIVADSLSTKKDLVNLLHFVEEKVEVIYPGIDKIFKPVSEDEKRRVKQKYDLFDEYILTVGTVEPRKNLNTMMSAFERFLHHQLISSRRAPLQLVLVGKSGWGEKIKAREYVKSLGYVKKEDLPGLYSGATFFIYPSLYEGFGFPVIEAMACGTAVITSNRGSLKEIASGALFVDCQSPDDIAIKMTQIYIDNDLKRNLIENGKKNAARFTWEKTAINVKVLYEKVASK